MQIAGQLGVGAGVLAAGIAVAELLGEVEAQALGEALGLGDRLGVLGEARRHRRRRGKGRGRVAAAVGLGLLQRLAAADRNQRVLQRRPPAVVSMDVAGGDAGNPKPLGEQRQPTIASPIPPPVGPLQLDPKPIPPEGPKQPPSQPLPLGSVPPLERPRSDPVPSTPGEADQPLRMLLHLLESRPRLRRGPPGVVPRMRVGRGKQPAQIPVPDLVFDQQSEMHVPAGGWRRLGTAPIGAVGPIGTGPAGPTPTVNSAPVIGRTPNPLQAWANSIDPQTPSWSVRAKAG